MHFEVVFILNGQDGAQRHRIRIDAGLRRGFRHLAQ